MGPIGRARKFAAAHTPTAFGRSCSSKSTVSADSAITMIPAPASASAERAAMNTPGEGAYAHAAELTANSASAESITCLRPYRSPSSPTGSIAAASTSRYPDENHCKSDSDACSACASVGRATLNTVPSKPTATTARLTAARAHHRREEAEMTVTLT